MSASERERAALVALLRLTAHDPEGLDAPGLADALADRSASELLAGRLAGDGVAAPDHGPPRQLQLIDDGPAGPALEELLDRGRAELAALDHDGIRLLSIRDEDYPANLRLVHDRPPALLVAGDLGPAPERSVAVVGSRRPSRRGIAEAFRLATELVAAGQTVVSGLAAGIDTAAHRATMAMDGRTIAVIGGGHRHAHPPANRELQAQLARRHAVLSLWWPAARPSPERFRRRNGLMSGLARATVIVEAGPHSGTRVQARLALAHGRPVCLLEPVLAQAWATELARRPGVHVVSGADEVVAIAQRAFTGLPGPR